MHIVDGALSAPVLIGGGVLAAGAIARGLYRLDPDDLPKVAVVSAAFFVASLIRIPIGVSNVHLLLNGVAGIMLGWMAAPAIFIALIVQAVFFGFGGLTVLGVNTATVALPALLIHVLFRVCAGDGGKKRLTFLGFAAGLFGVMLSAIGVGAALALTGREFIATAGLVIVSHIPIMLLEGVITAIIVGFLWKVKPELLARSLPSLSYPPSLSSPPSLPSPHSKSGEGTS